MNYRNLTLLSAIREVPCQHCGAQDGTVCAAHSNQQRDGKGTGSTVAHDYRVAHFVISATMIDQGPCS